MSPIDTLRYYESLQIKGHKLTSSDWVHVASASHQLGLWSQVIRAYTQVLKDPQYADHSSYRFNLGVALTFDGSVEEGIEHINQAISLQPRPLFFKGLADALSIIGEPKLADMAYQRCITQASVVPELSKVDSQAAIEALYSFGKRLDKAHIELCYQNLDRWRHKLRDDLVIMSLSYYAEAQLLKREEKHLDAFRLLQKGGKLHCQAHPFDWNVYTTRLNDMKKAYEVYQNSKPSLPAKPTIQDPQLSQPIFIVGMPRSGTTLCAQILSRHSQAISLGETGVLFDALKGWSPLSNVDIFKKPNLDEVSLHVRKKWKGFEDTAFGRAEECLSLMKQKSPAQTSSLGKSYRYVEKTPSHHLLVGWIHQLFPHAKIIHCRRDPISTCYSCFSQHFSHGHFWSYNLDEVGLYYLAYDELMKFWTEQGVLMHELHLEKLTQNPTQEIKHLLEFCDLSWEENCLSPEGSEAKVYTASLSQVREPIKSKPKAWRHITDELKPLQALLSLSAQERAELF